MPLRPCLGMPGQPCGKLTPNSRCTNCQRAQYRQRDQHRPSTSARGYGPDHQALRTYWTPMVEAGEVDCWRCTHRIQPGTPWDLGHDDTDRTKYRGPEHGNCNRSAAAASRASRQRTHH